MTLRKNRLALGALIFAIQFATIFLFIFGIYNQNLSFELGLSGAMAIAPVTGTYALLFIKYVNIPRQPEDEKKDISNPNASTNTKVNFVVVSLIGAVMISGVAWLIPSQLADESHAQIFAGFMETVFGGYLATIYGALFPKELFES